MNIPPCDKWGNPKNLNPCKKNYRRRRCARTQKLFNKFWKQKSIEEKIRGVNPDYYDLFLTTEEYASLNQMNNSTF